MTERVPASAVAPAPTARAQSAAERPIVLTFGEILWDFLPDGLFAGGAPFNVAYHLHRLGLDARPISAVGADVLGDELLRRLRNWKIATELIARDRELPTGYVRATVGAGGDAHYTITRDVAWDRIPVTPAALDIARSARALVFGSLAQRSTFNRDALDQLLAALPPEALRIFDVNLRPPHDDLALVRQRAATATVLKLNASEAARLAADASESPGREEADARALARSTRCRSICITAGSRGAGWLHGDTWYWEDGRDVAVADTVGAGDAFLAAFTAGLLCNPDSPPHILKRACRLGEWVATQRGATPDYASAPLSTDNPPSNAP